MASVDSDDEFEPEHSVSDVNSTGMMSIVEYDNRFGFSSIWYLQSDIEMWSIFKVNDWLASNPIIGMLNLTGPVEVDQM